MKLSAAYAEPCYTLLRVVSGLLFLSHGLQKLFAFPVPFTHPLSNLSLTAAVIELLAGSLIVLGLYSRCAAFIASGTMAVAYWLAHGLNHPLPIANGGELAALYCFIFLYIAAHGPGRWALNRY